MHHSLCVGVEALVRVSQTTCAAWVGQLITVLVSLFMFLILCIVWATCSGQVRSAWPCDGFSFSANLFCLQAKCATQHTDACFRNECYLEEFNCLDVRFWKGLSDKIIFALFLLFFCGFKTIWLLKYFFPLWQSTIYRNAFWSHSSGWFVCDWFDGPLLNLIPSEQNWNWCM